MQTPRLRKIKPTRQPTRKTAFPELSTLQALLLDIQRTTISNVSSLGPSDLRVDLYYPALPKPRTDQMLMIEVLVSSGTDTNRKKGLVAVLVEKLGEAGIDPNDIMVFFLETSVAAGSQRLLPSPD